jgi:chloramphenicol-sensitive protein RarD
MRAPPPPDPTGLVGTGFAFAFAASVLWGTAPALFKELGHVAPVEVFAQRVVWSVPLLLALVLVIKGLPAFGAILGGRRTVGAYLLTTALIAFNWGLYIWAVSVDRVTEVSLGYYIAPLMNVIVGVVVLRERLNPRQTAAVGLAALGVGILTVGAGALPYLSIVLAASWTLYSLVRTRAGIDPLTGLLVEAGLLAVPATVYLLTLDTAGFGSFASIDRATDLKLIAAGVVTALPVVFYLNAARHLSFSALGLSSYLSPTLQLGIAILYGEPFTVWHAAAFGAIWIGLALYSADAIRGRQAAATAAEG